MSEPLTRKQDAFLRLNESQKAHFWKFVDVRDADECWEWKGRIDKSTGRGAPVFHKVKFGAPRLALALTDGFLPEKDIFACHKCDNPKCCNPNHLWWGTHRENMDDCTRKGRRVEFGKRRKGRENPNAKLTREQIAAILSDKRSKKIIAADYSVGRTTIGKIRKMGSDYL